MGGRAAQKKKEKYSRPTSATLGDFNTSFCKSYTWRLSYTADRDTISQRSSAQAFCSSVPMLNTKIGACAHHIRAVLGQLKSNTSRGHATARNSRPADRPQRRRHLSSQKIYTNKKIVGGGRTSKMIIVMIIIKARQNKRQGNKVHDYASFRAFNKETFFFFFIDDYLLVEAFYIDWRELIEK